MKLLVLILMLSSFTVLGCTKHDGHDSKNSKSEKKEALYTCPMHPQIKSNKPGECPICGMDLVLFDDSEEEENDEHDHDSSENNDASMQSAPPHGRADVKLSFDKQQLIGIKTTQVMSMELFKNVRAPGRIAFDPELYTAQSEYLEAVRQWNKVKSSPLKEVKRSTQEMIKSAKVRLQVLGLNSEQIKDLSKKGSVSEGLIVGSGTGENLIYADVFEADLSGIKKGQSVIIEGSFLNGDKLKGEVIAVDQVIDPKTRTGKVRIKISQTKVSIRPESFVNVSIAVPLGKRLAIPLESLLDTGRDLFVFVKKDKGKFEPRKITKLFETDEHLAVLSGLSEGEKVVTSANFMLDSESRLKAVIKGVNSGNGHNH